MSTENQNSARGLTLYSALGPLLPNVPLADLPKLVDGAPVYLASEVDALLASRADAPSEAHVQLEAWQSAFGTSQLSHALARLESAERRADAPPRGEAVAWESRWFDANRGTWCNWERIEADRELTVEEKVADFRAYIAAGKKYEIRALYASPPPALPVAQKGEA